MAKHQADAYARFAEDHRTLGMQKRAFSPTLRIKALMMVLSAGALFWGVLIYAITG